MIININAGTEVLVKVGSNFANPLHPRFEQRWRDGHIVDIMPMGTYTGKMIRQHFCVLQFPNIKFWSLRGSEDWKSTKQSVYDLKKYLTRIDASNKQKWEFGYNKSTKFLMHRDYFIDLKKLLNDSNINQRQYDKIYSFTDKDPISFNFISASLMLDFFLNEKTNQRLEEKQNQNISSGVHSIGSGLDYDTWTSFEADIQDTLTGNLTGEGNDEETAISADVQFDMDTAGFLLLITAQAGDEHNGGAYGNGARVTMGTFDSFLFDETIDSDLADIGVSKLAFDVRGSGNLGLEFNNAEDCNILVNRNLFVDDDTGSENASIKTAGAIPESGFILTITNNIIYGESGTGGLVGIDFNSQFADGDQFIYNNTIVGMATGILQNGNGIAGTLTLKNNLCQGNGTDYGDDGGGFGTTDFNISEDATGPDAVYDNTDVHTNSVFLDFANDDYRLDVDGDATNLAIVDDGEDLSGTFTDDIQGQTRSTWYIGASEIVSPKSFIGRNKLLTGRYPHLRM